jgi:hypothetical protein
MSLSPYKLNIIGNKICLAWMRIFSGFLTKLKKTPSIPSLICLFYLTNILPKRISTSTASQGEALGATPAMTASRGCPLSMRKEGMSLSRLGRYPILLPEGA